MFWFYFYDIFFQKDFKNMQAIFRSRKENYESATKHESNCSHLNERPTLLADNLSYATRS